MNKLTKLANRLRWGIVTKIENSIAFVINVYNVQPYGYCPVQADGVLPTGQSYYFRSRGESWSVRISNTDEPLSDKAAWTYRETKYAEFEAGWIGKLEVVRNFNKAVKMYYNERSCIGGNSSKISKHGVSGETPS